MSKNFTRSSYKYYICLDKMPFIFNTLKLELNYRWDKKYSTYSLKKNRKTILSSPIRYKIKAQKLINDNKT